MSAAQVTQVVTGKQLSAAGPIVLSFAPVWSYASEVPLFSVPGVMRVLIGLKGKVLNLGCSAAGAEA